MIQLMEARIFHERMRPRRNRFGYGALYCVLPLSDLSARRGGPVALNRFGLFSLYEKDYGDPGETPSAHISKVLNAHGLGEADGEVRLMTLPRVLGYGFNPVSFWLCHDRDGGLRAAVAEVNNTFGERHSYLCCHDDHRAIEPGDRIRAHKVFHVSPFLAVEGQYVFRFALDHDCAAVAIDLEDGEGLLLRTSVSGRLMPLTRALLWATLLRNPLYPLKVIGLIHYQAGKLFLMGLHHFRKPPPPRTRVTHQSPVSHG
jgi:DUF1365 family protein